MEDSLGTGTSVVRFVAPLLAAIVAALGGIGYAMHEHHAAQQLAAQNQQQLADLAATRAQMNSLTAKVSELVTKQQAEAADPTPAPVSAEVHTAEAAPVRTVVRKPRASRTADRRLNRMQAQLDAQGKAIQQTRGDLASTKTELTGSIAKTHDELMILERRGERSYFEFDLPKSKQFTREGPLGVSLRKANVKHQYADLQLMVDDRALVQKHVNLDQPVMYYQADTEQPIQVVINDITKDHIHGYVSAPKYRKSELASMAGAAPETNAQNASDGIVGDPLPAPRKKLTLPPQ